tara:strand:- start:501 stop:974 length:474 start_codon:yes stop_codon:yes gene_type:complete
MPTVTGSAALTGTGTASLTIYSSWADRPYMMINNDPLTDHGRQASLTLQQKNVKSVRNSRGRGSNWYPRNLFKATVAVNWSMLPDDSSDTFDGRQGRIYLKSLVNSVNAIRLYIKKNDGTGYTQYNVFVNSYQESLVMRRNSSGGVLYNISMEFKEL